MNRNVRDMLGLCWLASAAFVLGAEPAWWTLASFLCAFGSLALELLQRQLQQLREAEMALQQFEREQQQHLAELEPGHDQRERELRHVHQLDAWRRRKGPSA